MELTPDIILNGENATKKIAVKAYEGAEVEIKPLKSGIFKALIKKYNITGNTDSSTSYGFLIDVCREGIANPTLANLVEKMEYKAVSEIGAAILNYSDSEDEEIENFTEAPMGN